MQKIHTKLTQKYSAYHHWHQTKHHDKIHWGVLVVFTLVLFSFIVSPVQLNFRRGSSIIAPTIQTQKAAAASPIIFEDNFDNYQNWSSSSVYGKEEVWPDTIQTVLGGPGSTAKSPDWYSYRVASISNLSGKPLYVVDDTDIHGTGGKSLKYNLENNSYMNGGGMDLYLGGGKTGGYDEIYIRTYIKLEQGFDFQNGGSQFIKFFRLYTGVDPDTDDFGPASTFATYQDFNADPRIKRSMNVYLFIVSDGNEDQRLKFAYFLGQKEGVDYIENPKVLSAATFNFKDYLGQWIYMEWYAKLNTVGQADGEMKVWIAPESNKSSIDQANPTASWTGLEIRSATDRKFNTIIMADNMSGQWERPVSEQTISWDDLVVSTAFVGPDYRSNSATGIIFEDNFDNSPDWSSGYMRQPQDQYTAWPDTREGGSIGNPPNWTSFRSINDYGEPTYKISAQNARGGTGKALTVNYENDSYIEGGGIDKWIGNPDGNGGGYDEIYIRWHQKFQPGFKWQSETDNLLKIWRVMIGANLNTMNPQDMNSYTNDGGLSTGGYIIPTWHGGQGVFWSTNAGTLGWGTREENTPLNISTPNFFVSPYWHLLTGRMPSGGESAFGDWQWHSMEFHIKLNDIGQKNILFEFWFDGKLIATKRDDLEFRKTPEKKLNFIILADNTFNVGPTLPPEQWLAIDDFVISTSYIGPDYVIGDSLPPDIIPPAQPTNLTATPISSSQINLSWTASTDDVAVAGYKIYRCAGSTCAPTTQIATSPTNSYSDTGLTASAAYTYTVSAYDAAGNESGKSSSVSATTFSQFKQADFNQDGIVNQLDFDILKQEWARTDKPVSDLNQDGIVDTRDLGIMMSEWNS